MLQKISLRLFSGFSAGLKTTDGMSRSEDSDKAYRNQLIWNNEAEVRTNVHGFRIILDRFHELGQMI